MTTKKNTDTLLKMRERLAKESARWANRGQKNEKLNHPVPCFSLRAHA